MYPRRIVLAWLAAALLMGAGRRTAAQTDFALQDGDVVVTLGDSNTAPGGYQAVLERYTVMRYPSRHVRFLNMGIGGETAANGLARLQRDVFDRGATVLVVTYGINDICWGVCADDAHKQAYYQATIDTVVQAVNHGVRVYVTSYPYTGFDFPVLHDMTNVGTLIAIYLGQHGIDIYPTMKALDATNGNAQCIADAAQCPQEFASVCRNSCNTWAPNDGIHLGEKGQRAWAWRTRS